MKIKPNRRYYLHRKLKENKIRIDVRNRNIFVPANLQIQSTKVGFYVSELAKINYSVQLTIS